MIHLKNILDCSLNQREKSQSYHVGKMLLNLHYTHTDKLFFFFLSTFVYCVLVQLASVQFPL